MNQPTDLDVETRLRATLTGRADDLPAYTDPFARFTRLERRHRTHHRAKLGGGIVGGLAVVGLVGSGIVPLPSWAPAINLDQASSPLLDAPTVGSLAGDDAWLAAFRERVPVLLADQWASDTDGHWRVDGAQNVHIVFAGDVGGRRLVLAAFPVRLGVLREDTAAWFQGPAQASPSAMQSSSTGLDLTDAYPSLLVTDADTSTATVVAIAPAGSTVDISLAGTLRADGTVGRTWLNLPRSSSGEYQGQQAWSGAGIPRLRVTLPGGRARVVDIGVRESLSDPEDPARPWKGVVDAMATQASLDGEHRKAAEVLPDELAAMGLDPGTTALRVVWSGTSEGRPALVVAAQPDGGGVLVLAVHSETPAPADDGSGAFVVGPSTGLRLVAPASGALTRPYAWRLREPGSDSPDPNLDSRLVAVVVPKGATDAEIVTANTRIPVALDATGYGTASLAGGTPARVVAFDRDGNDLGSTPVPPPEMDLTLMPGETAATSIVLADKSAP